MVGIGHKSESFRADIEGLRAIAVIMVLLYHLGAEHVPGGFAGVDVFFVISGFLITGLLAKEIEKTGTISLVRFYSRRAKRLFPAAALVLLATTVAIYKFVPKTRWQEAAGDIFAAATYFINWRLAGRSVDYLAEDSQPSFVQHFWSLAVEEQYYIIWPAIFLFGVWLLRNRLKRISVIWCVLVIVAVPSLVWSIQQTSVAPGPAYFSTATRMWQLAVGGAISLLGASCKKMPGPLSLGLGWIGFLAVVATAALVTPEMSWPGYVAALPTLGAAAIIASGFANMRLGPGALLGNVFLVRIGALSYSMYLWHWPLIEIAKLKYGELTLGLSLTLMAMTFVLSGLTYKLVENPIRYSIAMREYPRYALSAGLNFTMLGVLSAGLLMMAFLHQVDRAEGTRFAMGAKVLKGKLRNNPAGKPVDSVDWMIPDPAMATKDVPQYYEDCYLKQSSSEPKECYYGDESGDVTIALVGDSKAGQWLPALIKIAEKNGWRIVLFNKGACGFNSAMLHVHGRAYTECYEWNRLVLKRLLGPEKPDYVLTSQVRSSSGMPGAAKNDLVPALIEWWTLLEDSGIDVIALADNPHPKKNVYECVEKNRDQLTSCSFRRRRGSGTFALKKAARKMGNVDFIDLSSAICPTKSCAPVIGNVLIYRQGSHMTRTYVETLTPRLERELKKLGVGSKNAKHGK